MNDLSLITPPAKPGAWSNGLALVFVRRRGWVYTNNEIFHDLACESLTWAKTRCRDFFHYQMCGGMGAAQYCPRCGDWRKHR